MMEETFIARILLSLPVFMYATGCLLNTQEMVDMFSKDTLLLRVFVITLGLGLLAGGVGMHIESVRLWAGIGLAILMVVTAFSIHLSGLLRKYPSELGENTIKLQKQMSLAGVIKDLGMAGAFLLMATMTM